MQPLSPDSPRRVDARRFGAELARARKARGIGTRQIQDQVGVSRSTLRQYEAGYNLPSLNVATELAEALCCPRLVELIVAARTQRCPVCGGMFVNRGTPQRYCSDRCHGVAQKKRVGVSTAHRADVAERNLAEALSTIGDFRTAVASMCVECEPEGFCRQPECPLRLVSPLPLSAQIRTRHVVQPAAGPWGSDENRERTLAAIREANGRRWARAGEREAQSARTRQRWARDRGRLS